MQPPPLSDMMRCPVCGKRDAECDCFDHCEFCGDHHCHGDCVEALDDAD